MARVEVSRQRFFRLWTAADNQRGLGHAIAGQKCPSLESVLGEALGKLIQRRRPNRLGAIKRGHPTAQVDAFEFIVANLVDAQLICKVRRAADRRLVFRYRSQPADRLLQESHRAHQGQWTAGEDWHQNPTDQSHVVVCRQPTHTARNLTHIEGVHNHFGIAHQVGMRQHYSLGATGGTRCVLQYSQVVRLDARVDPVLFVIVDQRVCGHD